MSLLTLLRRRGRLPYSSKVLATSPASLIAYWPLSETSGTTIADRSGNGRNGTYTGVTLAQAQPPFTAPLWDGVNDYGNVYSAGLAGAFNGAEGTLALWLKVANAGVWTDTTVRRAAFVFVDGSNFMYLRRFATSNALQFVYTAGGSSKILTIGSLSSVDWLHLALTWSKAGDALKAYVNGVQSGATTTGLGTWAGVATTALLGAQSTMPVEVWNGLLAHATLWSTPLSAAQIASLATV